MDNSEQNKGPVAALMAVVALGVLGLKSGCAKIVSHTDDVTQAVGSVIRQGDGASLHSVEEGVSSKVGKELVQSGIEEGAQAGIEAVQERRESPSPPPMRVRRQ